MQFANESILYLLVLIPGLGAVWLLFLWRRRRRFQRIFDARFTRRFAPPLPWIRRVAQFLWVLLALTLGVIALARPHTEPLPPTVVAPRHDRVIALDVSRSMLAQDVTPNRLERAKAMLYDVIRNAPEARVALVAFRQGARRVCPLTRDSDFLLQALDGMDVDSAPRGPTNLAQAIREALAAFDPDLPGPHIALMVSDGEALTGDLDEALAQARRANVRFLTVGIGTRDGAPIPDAASPTGYQEHDGERVITRRVDETLERIARETGGRYLPVAGGVVDLHSAYLDFLQRSGIAVEADAALHPPAGANFQWFLFAAILWLLAAACLSRGRPSSATVRGAALLLSFCVLAPLPADGGRETTDTVAPRRAARRAMQWYREGRFEDAAHAFEAAAAAATRPLMQAILLRNAASAWFRGGDPETAFHRFSEALDRHPDPDATLRHDVAVAAIEAARVALPQAGDPDRVAAIRQWLQQAGTQLTRRLREQPPREAWHATLVRWDHALHQTETRQRMLQIVAQYGNRSGAQLAGELLQRQRAIRRELTAADRQPLPERLQRRQALAARQHAAAHLATILPATLGEEPDIVSEAQAVAAAVHSAVDLIADADERAITAVASAESRIYDVWKELAGYHALLEETIRQQSNVIAVVEELPPHLLEPIPGYVMEQQREAYLLTRRALHRLREAPERTPPADADNGTLRESRVRVPRLAREAAAKQAEAKIQLAQNRRADALTLQREAAALLADLRQLLQPPPDPPPPELPDDEEPFLPDDPPPRITEVAPHPHPRGIEEIPEIEMLPDEIDTLLERIRRHEHDVLEERRRRALQPIPGERDW